ncbi:protein Asterix [Primulina huaijiensis]|uniref:protein Asterix n=1 Tax=Primulina huaijiensis TaxID=1492673 RepID=UPI003CC6F457
MLSDRGRGKDTREMASQSNDPRQPSAARPYKPQLVAPQDLPVDYSGFIAVIFGVLGAMFRYKVCSWLAIIFCAQSLANMRNMENDLKQISMAMMFGIMGLVTNYMGLGPRSSTKS